MYRVFQVAVYSLRSNRQKKPEITIKRMHSVCLSHCYGLTAKKCQFPEHGMSIMRTSIVCWCAGRFISFLEDLDTVYVNDSLWVRAIQERVWNGITDWCVPRIDLLEVIVFRGLWVIKHAQNNSIGHVNKSLLVRRPWLFHSRRWWWRLRWWWWRWRRGCRRQVAKIIHLIAGNVNLQWPPLRSRLRKLQINFNSFLRTRNLSQCPWSFVIMND